MISNFSPIFSKSKFIFNYINKSAYDFWTSLHVTRTGLDNDTFKLPAYCKRFRDWILGYANANIEWLVKERYFILPSDICTRDDLRRAKNTIFPENSVCKFVGFIPFKIGSQGIKFSSAVPYFQLFTNWFGDLSVSTKVNCDKVMMKGGTGAVLPVLQKMVEEPRCKFSYEELYSGLVKRHQYINLPFCGTVKKLKLENVKLNPDSNSGFLSSLIGGMTRKESYSFSRHVAEQLFSDIKARSISCVSF